MQRGVIGEMTKKQREYLNEIYKSNERMIKLVFDMLNVLRLEGGALQTQKTTIAIPALYDELMATMEPITKKTGVILKNISKVQGTIEADMQILLIILNCFISNAIEYSNTGQEVILDSKEEAEAVVFSVKDSGIGIPKEEQKQIFERFYRASNAKVLKPSGTGLGLYIASLLAKNIGATILFESKENKGSTFYLRIPKRSSEVVRVKSEEKIIKSKV
ncbi:MAG: putative Histidine kinase [Parcubacteria group bacterium Gr01-1014_29]|nr:MAG: putative Histidine kinase [Parcubacteria group bacterium Gr01-1014_29]